MRRKTEKAIMAGALMGRLAFTKNLQNQPLIAENWVVGMTNAPSTLVPRVTEDHSLLDGYRIIQLMQELTELILSEPVTATGRKHRSPGAFRLYYQ